MTLRRSGDIQSKNISALAERAFAYWSEQYADRGRDHRGRLKELHAEREAARALREEQEAHRGALRLVAVKRDLAEERLRAYRRELFGAKGEARGSNQLGLFNEAEALSANSGRLGRHSGDETVDTHQRKRRVHRKRLDPNLPRKVVRHDLPKVERFCTGDVHALVEIGEQLGVIPEQLCAIQHGTSRMRARAAIAASSSCRRPRRITPCRLLTESALAWIATGKYQCGMPLYRQASLLRRFDGDISFTRSR